MYFFYNDIMIGSWSLVFLLYLSISFSGLMHGEWSRPRMSLKTHQFCSNFCFPLIGIFLSVMVNRIYMIMLICGLYAVILPTMNGALHVCFSVHSITRIHSLYLICRCHDAHNSGTLLLPIYLQSILFVLSCPCWTWHPTARIWTIKFQCFVGIHSVIELGRRLFDSLHQSVDGFKRKEVMALLSFNLAQLD